MSGAVEDLERAIGAYLAATGGGTDEVVTRWMLITAASPIDGGTSAVAVVGSPDMAAYEQLGLLDYVHTLTRVHVTRTSSD